MKKNPSLNSQAKSIFIGTLIATIFQFLIPALLVRMISQENFGVLRQFQLVTATFISFLGMGYTSSLFYFYPISDSNGKRKIIQQTQFLFLINLFIFLIIFFFYGTKILSFLNFSEFLDFKMYVYLFVSFMILSSIIEIIFTLEKNTFWNKLYPSIDTLLRFFLFLIFIFLFPGLEGPIFALVVYAFIRMIIFLTYSYTYLKDIYKLDYKLIMSQLKYSIPFGLAIIINIVSTRFDKFFINQYITPAEYGIYSIAFLGIPILGQFFNSIHNVAVPQIAIFMNENRLGEATELWKKIVDKTSNVTIPSVFLFWLLADEIITILYTTDYIEAANYYRIFILSFFISMFSYNLILRGGNKTRFILFSDIAGAIITIVIGIVLIPKIGLYGAITTALIGLITPMLVSLNIERKIMQLSFKNWVNWKNIGVNFLIGLSISIPLFFLKDGISNIYLRVVLIGFIFVIYFVIMQLIFNIFIFKQFLQRVIQKVKLS
jgi:O-antigen/teichoic acid export membrane protein